MAQAATAANRILSMRPDKNTPEPSYPPLADASEGASIEFRNVNFTYKSRDVPVLSNLNIQIPAGQFAALVGASGTYPPPTYTEPPNP
jgi:ABC-type bacteriocin/lantibiotic exporter with double-glycine peptidase domain